MAGEGLRPVLFDTDIGLGTPGAEIDDGAALIALAAAGDVNIEAITSVQGNVDVRLGAHNLGRLLHYLCREEIPTGIGPLTPLKGDKIWFADWEAGYGPTPPWPGLDNDRPADSLIVETIRKCATPLTILAVGPLTNLALALELDPEIVDQVDALYVMGGSVNNPHPEFNCRCDPEAAQIVLNAGWPVSMIGLEVTRQVLFTAGDFASLPQENRALALLSKQAIGWIERVESQGWEQGGCSLHDAMAVLAFLDDTLFEWQEASVTVELNEQLGRGRTLIGSPIASLPVRVATSCDVPNCKERIWSLLNDI